MNKPSKSQAFGSGLLKPQVMHIDTNVSLPHGAVIVSIDDAMRSFSDTARSIGVSLPVRRKPLDQRIREAQERDWSIH